MRILVLGSGGREHALVWKLRQSPRATKVYCAPGNGGIADDAECLPADLKSLDSLVAVASHAHDHAQAKDITDLSTEMLTSIESFFKRYNKLHDKEFRAVSRADAKTTSKLVKQ